MGALVCCGAPVGKGDACRASCAAAQSPPAFIHTNFQGAAVVEAGVSLACGRCGLGARGWQGPPGRGVQADLESPATRARPVNCFHATHCAHMYKTTSSLPGGWHLPDWLSSLRLPTWIAPPLAVVLHLLHAAHCYQLWIFAACVAGLGASRMGSGRDLLVEADRRAYSQSPGGLRRSLIQILTAA